MTQILIEHSPCRQPTHTSTWRSTLAAEVHPSADSYYLIKMRLAISRGKTRKHFTDSILNGCATRTNEIIRLTRTRNYNGASAVKTVPNDRSIEGGSV